MKFFLDNTFSPKVARALAVLAEVDRHEVVHLVERFDPDTDDLVWIPAVARWDGEWTILSGDRNIYKNPQRRAALLQSRRTIFFMPSRFPGMKAWEQSWRIFKWFPDIGYRAIRTRGQKIYDVAENGKISVLNP